ncbi:hypothetical protein E6C60_4047 [Paenibacillus algicola]|uniref:Uncharacterized protein n=1 Tax=Paenibacillus algicola TaxID=2565926 RepID=A0A4P8XPI4_9BACL|nr:hypothetical protein E6C60_4047 [Paenibacillus algicola]
MLGLQQPAESIPARQKTSPVKAGPAFEITKLIYYLRYTPR